MNPLHHIEKFPLARVSEKLVELANTMAKIDLAPALSDNDLHRLAARGLERNR